MLEIETQRQKLAQLGTTKLFLNETSVFNLSQKLKHNFLIHLKSREFKRNKKFSAER